MNDETNQPVTPSTSSGASSASPSATPSADVLKQAYKAFKKRLKLTRLDYESRIGRSPMSSGGNSTIVGIVPPDQFPREVWEELASQGKLKRAGGGLYTLP
ncbi:MAG TPA: hypothetical protein VHV77_10720 [Pirellulales bacterium]|jgi:hypothetical protein|nr:hypothetical protein [Pirellulales bacterium]